MASENFFKIHLPNSSYKFIAKPKKIQYYINIIILKIYFS